MVERTTVRLRPELLARAKRKAAAEGRTLTALIEDGLQMALAAKRGRSSEPREMPPPSKATGGPMPGFAGLSFSEIEELDDIEYVERMKHFK